MSFQWLTIEPLDMRYISQEKGDAFELINKGDGGYLNWAFDGRL